MSENFVVHLHDWNRSCHCSSLCSGAVALSQRFFMLQQRRRAVQAPQLPYSQYKRAHGNPWARSHFRQGHQHEEYRNPPGSSPWVWSPAWPATSAPRPASSWLGRFSNICTSIEQPLFYKMLSEHGLPMIKSMKKKNWSPQSTHLFCLVEMGTRCNMQSSIPWLGGQKLRRGRTSISCLGRPLDTCSRLQVSPTSSGIEERPREAASIFSNRSN